MVGVVERHSGKKRATGEKKGGWETRKRAYFYAQENSICQLLEGRELEWETIGECFFYFF